jgi:hypothetical protein
MMISSSTSPSASPRGSNTPTTAAGEIFTLPISIDFSLDDSNATLLNCTRLYALSITFSPADARLAMVPPSLTIATMTIGDVCRRTLRFISRVPLPTSLNVRAEFNDEEGRVHSVALPALPISFVDLLAPLPLSLRDAFDTQWSQTHDGDLGAESVRVINIERAVALRRIDVLWRPFFIDNREEEESGDHILSICLFLPPKEFLLFRMRIELHNVRCEIRTSYWRLLAHVDSWLDRLLGS